MKKTLLLLTGGMLVLGANAQSLQHNAAGPWTNSKKIPQTNTNISIAKEDKKAPHHQAFRTTAVTFLTEDFSSGAGTGLPTGWTSAALTSGTWHWAHAASSSAYSMGVMLSTTASNGWMIFDSDSIGAACGTCAPSGYLQSPLYNCSAHTTVRLAFENYFRKYNDSCSVWVGTTPGFTSGTYQVFPVGLNNGLAGNVSTANPSTVYLNISSIAASQPAVYIRFISYGYAGGSYSWMIDDLSLSELDPVDVALSKPSVIYASGSGTGAAAYSVIPANFADTLYPEVFITNYGATAQPTTNVNAQIFQGATSVYNKNLNVNLPLDAYDSLVDFSSSSVLPGYYSNTKATYTVPFTTNQAGDAVSSNNLDTAVFVISDSTWSENKLNGNGTVSVLGSSSVYSTGPARAWSPATGFVVKAGKKDTLTSVSVAFRSTTVAGQVIGVQIYHFDGSTMAWVYDGSTVSRALTSSDISTTAAVAWATFPVNVTGPGGIIILDGGTTGVTYAAVIKGNNNTAAVAVLESDNPAAYDLVGYTAYSDTSSNDGNTSLDFGATGLPYGESLTPLINLNFGTVTVGIHDVTTKNFIGKAYPNPANTTVSVPFTVGNDCVVTITLSDVVGQVMKSQTVNAIGGQSMKAAFSTDNLPSGIYLCTVGVNGEHYTSRVVVGH